MSWAQRAGTSLGGHRARPALVCSEGASIRELCLWCQWNLPGVEWWYPASLRSDQKTVPADSVTSCPTLVQIVAGLNHHIEARILSLYLENHFLSEVLMEDAK